MPTRLVRMSVKSVAAVKKPANRRRWLVVKADKSVIPKSENERRRILERAVLEEWGDPKDYAKAYLDDVFDGEAIVSMDGQYYAVDYEFDDEGGVTFGEPRQVTRSYVEKRQEEAMEKMEHGATTFDDAMFGRRLSRVYAALGERYGALMEVMAHVAQGDSKDKVAESKAALMDFVASVQRAIPSLVADLEGEMAKAGKKISAERLMKLKTVYATIGEIIAEQEEEGMADMTKKAPDATSLSKIGHAMAALFGRAAGADDATITALEKAAGDADPIPDSVRPHIERAEQASAELRKSNAELGARLEKAERANAASAEEVRKLREEQELRKFADEVAGFKDIGLDPARDAALLKSVEEKVGKAEADRLRELFRAQLAQKNAAGLMREVGATGAEGAADSVAAEVEQKIAAVMQKNDKADRGTAMQQVFAENPGLYDRYRRESTVRA